ncbi:MAG TPA: RDD family protein [Acidimicrobiales bacterium]|nr:RDD family protein [Acidimicrobiales bacterium]
MSMVTSAPSGPRPLVEGRQGHYAGAVTRLLAFAADVGASWALFTLGAAAVGFFIQLVTGHSFRLSQYQVVSAVALVVWEFVYFAYQWSLGGRTIGMAVLGIRVVTSDGLPIGIRQAVVRTLTFPLSFLFLGLGLFAILVSRDRHALHDRLAGTAVVYSWDARAARLRWLAQRSDTSG